LRKERIHTFQALMEKNGQVNLPASGYSMYPYIIPGDICEFRPINGKLKEGQIGLVVSDEGIVYSHRLHQISRMGSVIKYFFRGDANRTYYISVYRSQIIGVLTELNRNGKRIDEVQWTRRLWSFMAVRASILLLPFVYVSRRKAQGISNPSDEKGGLHGIGISSGSSKER
jgi:hypothetical protein